MVCEFLFKDSYKVRSIFKEFLNLSKIDRTFCIFVRLLPKYRPLMAIPPATPFLCPLVILRKLDSSTRLFNYSKNQYVYDTLI